MKFDTRKAINRTRMSVYRPKAVIVLVRPWSPRIAISGHPALEITSHFPEPIAQIRPSDVLSDHCPFQLHVRKWCPRAPQAACSTTPLPRVPHAEITQAMRASSSAGCFVCSLKTTGACPTSTDDRSRRSRPRQGARQTGEIQLDDPRARPVGRGRRGRNADSGRLTPARCGGRGCAAGAFAAPCPSVRPRDPSTRSHTFAGTDPRTAAAG